MSISVFGLAVAFGVGALSSLVVVAHFNNRQREMIKSGEPFLINGKVYKAIEHVAFPIFKGSVSVGEGNVQPDYME